MPLGRSQVQRRIENAVSLYALLLLDLPQDRGWRWLRHQHHGRDGNAQGTWLEEYRGLSRAYYRGGREASDAVESAPPFLREMRQRAVGLGSTVERLGVSVRIGDRHTLAQTAGRRRDHARLCGAVGRHPEGARPPAFRRISHRIDRRLASPPLAGATSTFCAIALALPVA